ncbi:unnamed protein product, partial [Chrysoparadoxa australica]
MEARREELNKLVSKASQSFKYGAEGEGPRETTSLCLAVDATSKAGGELAVGLVQTVPGLSSDAVSDAFCRLLDLQKTILHAVEADAAEKGEALWRSARKARSDESELPRVEGELPKAGSPPATGLGESHLHHEGVVAQAELKALWDDWGTTMTGLRQGMQDAANAGGQVNGWCCDAALLQVAKAGPEGLLGMALRDSAITIDKTYQALFDALHAKCTAAEKLTARYKVLANKNRAMANKSRADKALLTEALRGRGDSRSSESAAIEVTLKAKLAATEAEVRLLKARNAALADESRRTDAKLVLAQESQAAAETEILRLQELLEGLQIELDSQRKDSKGNQLGRDEGDLPFFDASPEPEANQEKKGSEMKLHDDLQHKSTSPPVYVGHGAETPPELQLLSSAFEERANPKDQVPEDVAALVAVAAARERKLREAMERGDALAARVKTLVQSHDTRAIELLQWKNRCQEMEKRAAQPLQAGTNHLQMHPLSKEQTQSLALVGTMVSPASALSHLTVHGPG